MRRRGLLVLPLILALVLGACGKKAPSTEYEDVEGDTWVDYTVLPGQGWVSIAEDFFGTGAQAQRIAEDNGATLDEAPVPGEVLKIRVSQDELDLVRRLADAREPYNAGVAYLDREDFAQAVEAFEEALQRAPEFVDARYNLGLAELKLGRPDLAVVQLEEVVRERPDDKDAHYAVASAWFHLGDYIKALPELEAALAIDPGFLRARYTLALATERIGDATGARDAWEAYLELDSTSAWAQEARQHLEVLP
jgi:tetratricopeptide (TPR) repeat protein